MTRQLVHTPAFVKSIKRLGKRGADFRAKLAETLEQLQLDAFHPSLRTHKLSGRHDGLWSCRVDYDIRVLFDVVAQGDHEVIVLQAIGTHDDVY